MRSSAAERTRPTFWDALVVLAVLAAAGSLLFLFRPRSGNFLTARIVLDHELVAEIELTALTGPVTLEVPARPIPSLWRRSRAHPDRPQRLPQPGLRPYRLGLPLRRADRMPAQPPCHLGLRERCA